MVLTFGLLQLVLADLLGSYVDFEGMHFINTTTQGNWTKKEKKTQRKLLVSKQKNHLSPYCLLIPHANVFDSCLLGCYSNLHDWDSNNTKYVFYSLCSQWLCHYGCPIHISQIEYLICLLPNVISAAKEKLLFSVKLLPTWD